MKLGEAMYKASQEEAADAAGAETAGNPAEDADPTVVDADFEEVDPDGDKEK